VTTNGRPLTTAEACALLDCAPIQLRRWRDRGLLTAEKERTAGTGRLLWAEPPLLDLHRILPRRQPGHTRRIKIPS
jgi:DNA-binding transcriptional MerR regulator